MMRATRSMPILAMAFLLFGCARAEPGPASPPVAWVGADTLTVEQLARVLVLAQPFPLETGATVDLARHWQFVMALAHGDGRPGAAIDAAMRAAVGEAAIGALRSARFGDPARAAETRAAATFAAGSLRLVAHVLRRADANARVEERTIQRRAAEAILRDLRAGGSWEDANRRNEDDAARSVGGMIALVARGELPQPLDSVAFALPPGGYSDVVETAAGYHVLHRPRLDAVRVVFVQRLAQRMADEQERELGVAAARRREATLAPVAPLRVSELAIDPWAALTLTDPVGSFAGGILTGGDLARALAGMSWDARRSLPDAPAAAREAFAGRALVHAALRADADSAALPVDTAALRAGLEARVDSLLRRLPARAADPRLAVDRYMGMLSARQVPMVVPESGLWAALLGDADAGLRIDALPAALERARTLLIAGGYTEDRT